MKTKKCTKCKQHLPLKSFSKNSSRGDDLSYYCKDCERIHARNRKQRNPETERLRRERYYTKHRDEILTKRKEWYRKNKHKVLAYEAVKRALYDGLLEKEPCEVCGNTKSVAHHRDYDKPLEVNWLCHKHHMREHYGKENLPAPKR